MATEPKVHIIWNGKGGELDSRTAEEGTAAANALREMLAGNHLNAGDTIEVKEIE